MSCFLSFLVNPGCPHHAATICAAFSNTTYTQCQGLDAFFESVKGMFFVQKQGVMSLFNSESTLSCNVIGNTAQVKDVYHCNHFISLTITKSVGGSKKNEIVDQNKPTHLFRSCVFSNHTFCGHKDSKLCALTYEDILWT